MAACQFFLIVFNQFFHFRHQDVKPDDIKNSHREDHGVGEVDHRAQTHGGADNHENTKNDLEYILTATIHVNKDGIFNDDVYEYDEIGMPFLAQLGREIHAQLLNN